MGLVSAFPHADPKVGAYVTQSSAAAEGSVFRARDGLAASRDSTVRSMKLYVYELQCLSLFQIVVVVSLSLFLCMLACDGESLIAKREAWLVCRSIYRKEKLCVCSVLLLLVLSSSVSLCASNCEEGLRVRECVRV